MWVIFDNLSAMILGGTLLLMMITLQQRMVEINLEQTTNYIVKKQANDLVSWMEEELLRIGENVDFTNEVPFSNPVNDNSTGVTRLFEFFRDSIDANGQTIRIYFRYQLIPDGYRIIQKDSIPVYRLKREVKIGDNGSWVEDGGSPALISYFRVDMLDKNAQPLTDPVSQADQVQNTRVRVTLVTPFETSRSQVLQRVYYGSTLLIPRDRNGASGTTSP